MKIFVIILLQTTELRRELTSLLLDSRIGFPPQPRIIPATIVDLPVPFGPIMMFKLSPGKNFNSSYVLKGQNVNKKSKIVSRVFEFHHFAQYLRRFE
jgi:hypothetical protein